MKKKIIRTIIIIDILAVVYIAFRYTDVFRDEVKKVQDKKGSYSDTKDSLQIIALPELEEALAGIEVPDSIRDRLCLVQVGYFGFDSQVHSGYLITDIELGEEVDSIFERLLRIKFPIEKLVPLTEYNWSDSLSMAANNTSCFNYRNVKGSSRLSDHALGRAIDINPGLNPYIIYRSDSPLPVGATYTPDLPGTISAHSDVVKIFAEFGWKWGGHWKYTKDYQHFYRK